MRASSFEGVCCNSYQSSSFFGLKHFCCNCCLSIFCCCGFPSIIFVRCLFMVKIQDVHPVELWIPTWWNWGGYCNAWWASQQLTRISFDGVELCFICLCSIFEMYQLIACTSLYKRCLSRSFRHFSASKIPPLGIRPQRKIAQGGSWNSSIQQMTTCEERWKAVVEAVAFLKMWHFLVVL